MGGAICALHFVSVLARETIAKISQYVNIFLHIALFCVLLLSSITIEISFAIFMTSAFIYVLIYYIRYEMSMRKSRNPHGKESKNL